MLVDMKIKQANTSTGKLPFPVALMQVYAKSSCQVHDLQLYELLHRL